ncbi:Teneurin-m [Thelohanellus kitauei]|uniref:Teneurin-m n=1 Tax=Thelohanellus kitauei TaxID=669202 RepID=A0A0C2JT10_THEKT|nr:Teneurin-m [Thelohanellus kitauei]
MENVFVEDASVKIHLSDFTAEDVHALMLFVHLPRKGNVFKFLIYGNAQGTCECGKCKCNIDYKGTDCSEMVCDHPIVMNKCKETEGAQDCSGRGTCVCGKCTCPYEYSGTYCETLTVPTVRCSDVNKCMVKVFDSNELLGCNITVTFVKKLDESTCNVIFIQAHFAHACQMVHKNCVRSFVIHIDKNGKLFDHITLKRLNPKKSLHQRVPECANDSNHHFKIRL